MVAEREVLREEGRFEEAEEVHDQLDNMGVKILAKERSGNMATPKAADKTVIPKLKNLAVVDASVCNDSKTDVGSNEEGNWSDGSEDSSQEKEVQFFVMFTPRPEAQAQRASQGQGLSSVCEYSEDEIRQLVAQRERARAAQDFEAADEMRQRLVGMGVAVHDDKRLWKAVDGRQGTIITGGSESTKCSLTKNDILARIALREEARWQKDWEKGDRLREELRAEGCELIDNLQCWRTADGRHGFYPDAVKGPWTCSVSADAGDEAVVRAAQDAVTLSLTSIEALVAAREKARESRDFKAADAIRDDLKSHGVEIWDKQRMWKSIDGRRGSTVSSSNSGSPQKFSPHKASNSPQKFNCGPKVIAAR